MSASEIETPEAMAQRLERETAADESFDGMHMDCDGIFSVLLHGIRADREAIREALLAEAERINLTPVETAEALLVAFAARDVLRAFAACLGGAS